MAAIIISFIAGAIAATIGLVDFGVHLANKEKK